MAKPLADTTLFRRYSQARREFLDAIGCNGSCRDPLAEFAERLVHAQIGGTLATSRVQKGHDLVSPNGRRVQVKYLANPSGVWRNGHWVLFNQGIDDYAVVFFEDMNVRAIVLFPKETILQVCSRLKKRHPRQEESLQITQANFKTLINDSAHFEDLGVQCFSATE